ncbi:anthranilate synthase component I family protein [Bermanella marisrubri]|uniref:Para-aminobenzoate synthase component I n=1 Tax=Bermanella marisrubri TaxID=207949 RepID=Q1MXZ1_9GAMM|nr:anthranilate synthase component I family protein [Bermanella marisrubri]EAT10838.1 para-aminobenzoate synthase component I [Oceanobacter sp. RED65] [Bermanella marisrubri]QIZ84220.1 anthranilate synthase component I family protein [Bermanella marisrubri]
MKPDFFSIPYLPDTSFLLEQLKGETHLVALESANPKHPNGRWSIISASPTEWITLHKKVEAHVLEEDIAKLANKLPTIDSDFPFTGGVLGLLSYELGESHIVSKNNCVEHSPPIAVYGLYTWAFLFDHQAEAGYLVYWSELSHVKAEQLIKTYEEAYSKTKLSEFNLTSDITPAWTKAQYLNKFDSIKRYINSGDCYQINLTQLFRGKYNGSSLTAYSKIKAAAKAPYATYFDLGDCQLASASPELFIEFSGGKATTKPIKGTRPRSIDFAIDSKNKLDLSQSEKDRSENIMIVDLLRNDLSKHGNEVNVEKLCEVETFETVHHLVSTVSAKVEPERYLRVLLDAFPGGSITGAPKTRAMEIIDELEDFDRRFYCGSCFAISSSQKVMSNILIRSFIFDQKNSIVTCWAGGGIVADSEGEEEYQESLDKISKLIEAIS